MKTNVITNVRPVEAAKCSTSVHREEDQLQARASRLTLEVAAVAPHQNVGIATRNYNAMQPRIQRVLQVACWVCNTELM